MRTKIGNIVVRINNKEVNIETLELPLEGRNFHVDGRYKIVCTLPEKFETPCYIECLLENNENSKCNSCIETGENLALISFYNGNCKLSLGTQGDIQGLIYNYLDNGIEIVDNIGLKKISFFVAWIETLDEEKEDIYTWFAADPNYEGE